MLLWIWKATSLIITSVHAPIRQSAPATPPIICLTHALHSIWKCLLSLLLTLSCLTRLHTESLHHLPPPHQIPQYIHRLSIPNHSVPPQNLRLTLRMM